MRQTKQKEKINKKKTFFFHYVVGENSESGKGKCKKQRRPLFNITTPFQFPPLFEALHTPTCSKRTSIPPNPHHFPHRNIFSIKQHTRFNFW